MAPTEAVDTELPAYSADPEPHKDEQQPAPSPASAAGSPSSSSPPSRSKLFKLACPLAYLVGAGITASTTYALVRRVQHLIATASVNPNPQTWISAARTQVYDPCYFGCDDCNDPNYAWNACQRTLQLTVEQGSICDANRMWNWRERYPENCLAAMGDVLKGEALERLKQSYRNQLALVILTVLGGVVGGSIVYCIIRRWARKRDKNATLAWSRPPPYREKASGRSRRRLKLLLPAFFGLFGRKADAYACVGHDQAANQFFVSPNGTISGVIHGWFSNCYDRRHCYRLCSPSCLPSGKVGQICSQLCSSRCHTTTYVDKAPWQFVQDMAPKVQGCGFQLVDSVPEAATARVANANIERNYWVEISVNGYNVTSSDYTDEMVLCLHHIGG
ncbi:hypothetical protein BR93DRAFT_77056 [Coniochaeta sp. PMI_546]|nr:hypothetical protein BR93DRAFT_77056 [Coniochaeta sp. PMI_546]